MTAVALRPSSAAPSTEPSTGPDELDGLAGWAVGLMESLGGPGAAVLVGLDNLFPPVPSELVLPLAGFAASRGTFSFVGALFWTTLGSVVGAWVVYAVGAALGRERTRALVARVPLLRVEDVDRSEAWFARHGAKAVLLGRMVPLFRSMISVPAGIQRMPQPLFLGLTALGSLVWNAVFVTAGYLLGERWYLVEEYAGIAQKAVVAAVVVAVAAVVVRRVRERSEDPSAG